VSPYASPCGSAEKICIAGSAIPVVVPAGYYSNEDTNENVRVTMHICPQGQYCPGDAKRYDWPAGGYIRRV